MTNIEILELPADSEFKYSIFIETSMDMEVYYDMLNDLFEIELLKAFFSKEDNTSTLKLLTNNFDNVSIFRNVICNSIAKSNGQLN